jgi:hypothetical protein
MYLTYFTLDSTPPTIVDLAKEYKFQLGSVSNIPCTAKGDPTPKIWFEKDGKVFEIFFQKLCDII